MAEGEAGEVIQSDEESEAGTEIEFQPKKVLQTVSSIAWRFFVFRGTKEAGPKKEKVFCRLCPKSHTGFAYNSSTTNLTDHLKRNHKDELKSEQKEIEGDAEKVTSKQPPASDFFKKHVVKWSTSSNRWKEVTKVLTKMIIKDRRPVSMVEGAGFIAFMAEVRPEYTVPTHNTITNYMEKMYEEEKETLKAKFEEAEFVAATSDGGAVSNGASFQDTNACIVTEDFKLESYVLAVKESKEEHTAENYRKNQDEVMEDFKLEEKLVKTVTDNEAKMNAAFNEEERTGCMAHIMHKSWEKGSKEVKEIHKVILKMRKIGRKSHKSYKLKYGLAKAQKKMGIKVKRIQQGRGGYFP